MTIKKMLKEFLILNKDKIKFGLKWTSILFTTIVLIAFAVGRFYGQIPKWSLFITTLVVAGVFFPIFIWTLGIFKDYLEFKRTNEILNRYPYNELIKNGFHRVMTNKNTKWLLSQIMLQGYFEDYPMDCEVENGVLKMIALVNRDNFKKEHIEELRIEFGESKVDYDWLGIALKYNVEKERLNAYGQLSEDLKRFITFFKKKELKPWDKPW